jgi:hypothetical protein
MLFRLSGLSVPRQILIEGGEVVLERVRESVVRRVARCIPIFFLSCSADASLVWGEILVRS